MSDLTPPTSGQTDALLHIVPVAKSLPELDIQKIETAVRATVVPPSIAKVDFSITLHAENKPLFLSS